MKNTFKYIALAGLLVITFKVSSQQTVLTNFYYKNLYSVNPASAGSEGQLAMALNHRQQWVGVSGAPISGNFNIHSPFGKNNAAGFQVNYNSYGLMHQLGAKATYVYNLKFGKESSLSFGLSAGFGQTGINYSAVRTQDYSDELVLEGEKISGFVFDADFGLSYKFKGLQIGVASLQLIETSSRVKLENETTGYFSLSRHFVANAMYDFRVADKWTLTPAVLAEFTQVSPFTIEGMLYAEWDQKLFFGAGYRKDAGILGVLGCNIADQFSVAYSYEMGFSGIAAQSKGSHEIMIGFKMNRGGGKKLRELEDKLNETNQRVDDLENAVEKMSNELENVINDMQHELDSLQGTDAADSKRADDLEKRIKALEERKQEVNPTVISDDVMENLLYFELNGSELDHASKDRIDEMIEVMKQSPDMRIKVKGYTCNVGDESANKKLSKDRASQVRDYFIEAGIPEGRVDFEGLGSADAVAPNDTELNREKNRRVEVEILSK